MEFSIWVVRDGLGTQAWAEKPVLRIPEGLDEEARKNLQAANDAFSSALMEWKVKLKPPVYGRHADAERMAQTMGETGFVLRPELMLPATIVAFVDSWDVKKHGSEEVCPVDLDRVMEHVEEQVLRAIDYHIQRRVYRNVTKDFLTPSAGSTTP